MSGGIDRSLPRGDRDEQPPLPLRQTDRERQLERARWHVRRIKAQLAEQQARHQPEADMNDRCR